MSMPRKLPLHVDKNTVKGKTYWSFRIGKGPRIRLPVYGTEEFDLTYAEALAGNLPAKRNRRSPEKPGTIAALITSYKRTDEYLNLRATSKLGYNSRLDMLRAQHGHRAVAGLTRDRIESGILRPLRNTPSSALDTLKKLRILIKHAIGKRWLPADPSLGIKRPKPNEVRSWTDAEIALFQKRWPVGTKQRLAFDIYFYVGQRGGDVYLLTWSHFEGGYLRLKQSKTKVDVEIEVHPDLQAHLDVAPRKHITIINTEFGRPFSRKGFGQWFRKAMTDAGLPLDCKPHGIRKAMGRILAESGASTHSIMAVLGHKTLAEAERYTRDADKRKLASAGIAVFRKPIAIKHSQTASKRLGKTENKKGKST
jgi:integrase